MSGRYAAALFALAKEQGNADRVGADLKAFGQLVAESPDLQRFVRSPVFSSDDQLKALAAILDKTGFSEATNNFLKLVASKRRLFAVADMIRDYNALLDDEKGVTRAEVTIAEPLADSHRAALEEALKGVTGGQSVEINYKVDPSIIGGLVVKLGSRMVDASLKTKLNSIRTLMKEVG